MYYTRTLDNGLRFVHLPLASPVVYVGIAIGVGTRHERRGEYGLAHFTEHMLFKGTRLRSSERIIRRLEEVGGELNAYTSKEETILYALCPQAYARRALQLMCDIVQHSRFDAEELRKEQTVVIDEIHSYEDSPSELIWDEFEDMLFRGHSLGHGILGTERSVASFTQAKEHRFYTQHYRPDNMAVFVQGEVDAEALSTYLESLFPRGPRAVPYKHSYPALPELIESRYKRRRKDTSQSHVMIGTRAYALTDERRLGLSLLVNILGGPGMSSWLNMSLREQAGLVYQVECNYTAYADTGLVAIYFGCSPQHEAQAIDLAMAELARMASGALTERELAAAKRQLKGQLTVSSDGHESYFLNAGKAFLHLGRVEPRERILERIDALHLSDLLATAREIFAPERMSTLVYR